MALLTSYNFSCRIFKVRNFDIDIRVQSCISVLYDVDIECIVPKTVLYDNIIYYVREAEIDTDPFIATKEDTASFFSINENKEGLIESTYISSNLKIISPLSEALNRPLSRFDSNKSISSEKMASSGTDDYVALNFEEIEDFNNLEIVRNGIGCVLFGCIPNYIAPTAYSFSSTCDITNIKYAGILSSFSIPQNYETDTYCSFYFGILYIPNDASTYHFSLTASSLGYMLLDDTMFISQGITDSVLAVTNSSLLKKGYHTFLIRHYASNTSTNDVVRLQFKRDEEASYTDFTVANLNAVGVKVYSFPVYESDIVKQGDTFFMSPDTLINASLDSLYMKVYRPIIVLARKYSELLQKEFNRIYYVRTPDIILSSVIKYNTTDFLLTDYDFPLLANGIILEANRSIVESPYITYVYNTPVKISKFDFFESKVANTHEYDSFSSKSFTFSIVDNVKERVRVDILKELLDISACQNIAEVQLVNNSDTYLRIIKEDINAHTVIVFKDAVVITEITIRDPILYGVSWGVITSFRVYLKATEIVKLIDDKGEMSIIQTTEDSNLTSVDYDYLGYVPMVFNHKNIPTDVQYGSEFIMFCLDVLGDIDTVDTLGNVYVLNNYDDHTIFNTDYLLNYMQLSQEDDRKFELVTDLNKSGYFEFCYVGYSTAQDVIMQSTFDSIIVQITNTSNIILTDYHINLVLPNISTGYTCTDSGATVIPVVGITHEGGITADVQLWNTSNVKIKVPSLNIGGTLILTFIPGSFSSTALFNTGNTDVTDWLPTSIETELWLDASNPANITISTGVSQWLDLSGKGRHAVQPTAAYQPTVSSINGIPAIYFDGTNDSMYSDMPAGTFTNGVHVFAIMIKTGANTTYEAAPVNRTSVSGYSAPWDVYNNVIYYTGGGLVHSNAVDIRSLTTTCLFSYHLSSTRIKEWKNGTQLIDQTIAYGFPDTATVVYIGSRQSGTTYLRGNIGEIIVVKNEISTEDRQKIESYLCWKWGIQVSLPVNHPFYVHKASVPVPQRYTWNADLLKLPVVSAKVPLVSPLSSINILALKSTSFPTPSLTSFDIPSVLTLATILVTELTGDDRTNVEIMVDISDVQHTFKCPFVVCDANTRQKLDTVGVNNDNSVVSNFGEWNGYRIRFRVPILKGGLGTLFLIRVGNFQGEPSSFVPSVQSNLRHNYHFSGSLLDSITNTKGTDGGVIYNSDKLQSYYKAAQFINGNTYARLSVTTKTTDFSISFWFINMTNNKGILCLSNDNSLPSTNLDFKFSINTSGYLQCQIISGTGTTLVITDKFYNDNQWHHVVVTCSSTEGIKLYTDKIQRATSSITTRTVTTNYAYIGWSDTYFIGSVDEFRVYDKVLSSTDVITLYTLFDGTINDTEQQYIRTNIVHSPSSRITNLSDLSSLQGTPRLIYKYIGIDETLIREID